MIITMVVNSTDAVQTIIITSAVTALQRGASAVSLFHCAVLISTTQEDDHDQDPSGWQHTVN